MKISILTATYNRGEYLKKLYSSILENDLNEFNIEWLIMDDGSTDNTKEIVKRFIEEEKFEIKYYKQENQGKMQAINNLMEYVMGDVLFECDSDDWLTNNAFQIIKKAYVENKERKDLYGLCFLKYTDKGKNLGKNFKNKETSMFDLYFKEGENGEKVIVFFTNVRKKYKHIMENGESFVTEARLYHKMDLNYNMVCYNEPIMICSYEEDGYTRNINKIFIQNPYGYFKYFKEIFEHDMRGVSFSKRLYAIKHYILFGYITKKYNLADLRTLENKIIYLILLIPGIVKTKKYLTNLNI